MAITKATASSIAPAAKGSIVVGSASELIQAVMLAPPLICGHPWNV
jgi:hypothetical protein